MEKIKSFQDLKIWQEGHALTLEIFKLCKDFPKEEQFGLISQLKRSSSSVPANIAEGMGRNTKKEFLNFLYITRGSAQETIYHLILSKDLKYLDEIIFNNLSYRYNGLSVAINKLINILKSQSLNN